jgi:hypothetical protein
MKRTTISCFLVALAGCTQPAASPKADRNVAAANATRHGERATVTLSGTQELDIEVVSFRATNKRRQSWVFGFQKLGNPEQFTLELDDNDSFAMSFIKNNPEFMKEYWEEQLAVGKKEKKWDYTKPVNPHPRFHIKVDAIYSIARILEWKPIE